MKTKKLDKQLATYTTAAGAVLLGAAGVNASIQYSSIDATVTEGNNVEIDLDGGGVDFTFFLQSGAALFLKASVIGAAAVDGVGMAGGYALNFAKDAWIGVSGTLTTDVNSVAPLWSNLRSAYGSFFRTEGNFNPATTGYLGVDLGDNVGWVHIDSIDSGGSYHIDGYAYQDDGSPIQAGAVPEPSSLALLAIGAAGLRFLRKRYDKV